MENMLFKCHSGNGKNVISGNAFPAFWCGIMTVCRGKAGVKLCKTVR